MSSFERVQFGPQQIVFTRENGATEYSLTIVFTRENHPASLGTGTSCSLSPGTPLRENPPPRRSMLSSRSPGSTGASRIWGPENRPFVPDRQSPPSPSFSVTKEQRNA